MQDVSLIGAIQGINREKNLASPHGLPKQIRASFPGVDAAQPFV